MTAKVSGTLTGLEWAQLLCEHPELADQCDWTAFDGNAWHCLLCERPQFAGRCDWSFTEEWNAPSMPGSCKPGSWYWETLLASQPQFANRCNAKRKSEKGECSRIRWACRNKHWKYGNGRRGKMRALYVKAVPESASSCRVDDFTAEDWIEFLQTAGAVPEAVLGKCRIGNFTDSEWCSLLTSLPAVPEIWLRKCPWNRFDGTIWADILSAKNSERYLEHCPWDKFGEDDWRHILYHRPECRNEFDAHSNLKYEDLHMEDWEPDWFWEFGGQ
ncbi:MAG: hypothetical protein IK066_05840 [Kiritimatiellae bacterium]|nr:hypothetical protein [Kiritimatiellia bacterium]